MEKPQQKMDVGQDMLLSYRIGILHHFAPAGKNDNESFMYCSDPLPAVNA
ncbi:MAG TPA: hypothetical protein VFQ13_11075 [Anaerolineales bacterium]|nr:hypothetical protein [Anaerolineales bacterium]